ncbi:MAG: recombination-associated protein RdgC [Gammaproteobacteria bacterium]|nr:recombination-associated protein RdgC [Gammaproteobacteria bacterium]MBU0786290.1 recombination-associated protein RdgC [Gammaproteobacteria bacterium]MBU0814490.1 recombination-associated protein RdgC [Gammaproteobacteria bacterium]MBU1786667.1 recombination-associated protein RdgC [Gammaproteobacteria bacterium]
MFKNVMVYRIGADWSASIENMEEALSQLPYVPCGATEQKSVGWVPPRSQQHGALVELVGGHRILCFMIESKAVPGAVIKRRLDERVAHIEATEGRKPGRKESRTLRDDILLELLPMAFSKTGSVMVWLDLQNKRLVLDCGSQGKADEVITALVNAFPTLQISPLNTQVSPQASMTQWLTGGAEAWPAHFAQGREVELKSSDEMNSVVKFTRHHLEDQEMRRHIDQGKLPTKLAMDWDGRVSFVLTENAQLKKVAFLEGVFEDNATVEEEGGFDADVAIATGELSALITDLTEALGGELVAT